MKNFTIMIKPASSLCNMQCTYCFYADVAAARAHQSLGIMSPEVATAIIQNVAVSLTKGDQLTFSFQGGEPMLAGLEFFTFFVSQVKAIIPPTIRVHYAMQTNGTLVTDEWCELFKAHGFLLGVSIDGDAALHNQNRTDTQGKGSFNRVMKAKRLFDVHKITYNVLCVLNGENARYPRRIWEFFIREKIAYIQFIPCLEPLASSEKATFALTGDKFYTFYASIFSLWKKGLQSNQLIKVQLFEDLAALHLYGHPVTCGLSKGCSPQIILEADGSAYPCDFYVLDAFKVGNLATQTLEEVFKAVLSSPFYAHEKAIPAHCHACAHYPWCQGGCKRMSKAVYSEGCGMRMFLDAHLQTLLQVYRQFI